MGRAAVWRVIHSGHRDAYTNMAVDEAIREAVGRGTVPPTLRIYGWRPPGVSLGYFQEADEQVDLTAIRQRGWDLVRRPTGGRAILHDDEVTYSVCVTEDGLAHGDSVLGSYRELSQGIQRGLELLGIQADLGSKPPARGELDPAGSKAPPICFTQSTRADMVARGRKIVGSAQVRRDGVILQHGSVPMTLNVADHLAVMPGTGQEDDGAVLSQAAVGVSEVLGRPVSFEELGDALVAGFAEALGVEMQPGQLTETEQARAAQLRSEKYATEQWNIRRPAG